jgi:hypothetical protein
MQYSGILHHSIDNDYGEKPFWFQVMVFPAPLMQGGVFIL